MKPVVDRLKQDYQGKVEFRLINADNDPDAQSLMTRYGAQYVPTFVFLNQDGSVSDQVVGTTDEGSMRAKLDALK